MRSRSPTQYEAQGTVAVCGGGLLQHDFWGYLAPAGDVSAVSCPFFQLANQQPERFAHIATRPVLSTPEQAQRQGVTLEVDASGKPARWAARLQRDETLAFLTRMVDSEAAEIRPPAATTDSPLQPLAREAYEAPGVRVIGEGYPRTDVPYGFVEVFLKRDP